MSNTKRVRIVGMNDEARSNGSAMLNGVSIPLGVPVELDDMAIEHIRTLSNYSRLNISTLNEYQILEMLEKNDPSGRYTLDEAIAIKNDAHNGNLDVRIQPLVWNPDYAVEIL